MWLSSHPLVIAAARMGEQFSQDPVNMLDCDDDTWLIRLACARVVNNDRKEQSERIKSGR